MNNCYRRRYEKYSLAIRLYPFQIEVSSDCLTVHSITSNSNVQPTACFTGDAGVSDTGCERGATRL
jgi:hypothetical protein